MEALDTLFVGTSDLLGRDWGHGILQLDRTGKHYVQFQLIRFPTSSAMVGLRRSVGIERVLQCSAGTPVCDVGAFTLLAVSHSQKR